ncbi:MAG: hypothetical protein ACLP7F_12480 [Acidimicrobiales bacterium]
MFGTTTGASWSPLGPPAMDGRPPRPDSAEQAERAARDAEVLVTALLGTLAQG